MMDKIEAMKQIGEMDQKKETYSDYNSNFGTFYVESHENGKVHYSFSKKEMKMQEEDLPFDDQHITRILDDDDNIIWQDLT